MLTNRQIRILKLIVDDFIKTGQPVGSRTLSKRLGAEISPATIRNEMSDLVDYGYILQPHISAGRIPTLLGLRYYIDEEVLEHTNDEFCIEGMDSLLASEYERNEKLLQKVADTISEYVKLPVFISAPKISKQKLINMKLIRVSSSRTLLIIVTDTEDIKTVMLQSKDISQEELDLIAKDMLDIFSDSYLDNIDVKKLLSIKLKHSHLNSFIDYLIPALNDRLKILDKNRIVRSGMKYVIEYGEFKSAQDAGNAYLFLEDEELLAELLDTEHDNVDIKIADEIEEEALKSFSLVKMNYDYAEGLKGTIAMIGPIRMNYLMAKNVIEACSDALSDIFSGIHL